MIRIIVLLVLSAVTLAGLIYAAGFVSILISDDFNKKVERFLFGDKNNENAD